MTLHDIMMAGSAVGAVISALALIFNGFWVSRSLETFKHKLSEDQEKRQRRADYVRGQIDNLYGPLAFFVEASARHFDTERAIKRAGDEYFAKRDPRDLAAENKEMDEVIATANRYIALVSENSKEMVTILRKGWGWLDADDVSDAGAFLTHVARLAVEFEGGEGKLPGLFYVPGALKNSVEAPSYLPPAFIERIRRRLSEKQRELEGLTGAEPTHQAAIAAPVAKPALPPPSAPPALPAPKAG